MDEIIYKLPKDIELSKHLKDQALAYLDVRLYGSHFYIPITKEIKKQFHLIERKGKLIATNWKELNRLYDITQDIIDSIYLQVRDYVCAGIEQNLDQNLREGFSKLFEKLIHKQVTEKVNLRLENKNDTYKKS
jgi:hypothetical protein